MRRSLSLTALAALLLASVPAQAQKRAKPKVEEDVAAPNISHTPVKEAKRGEPLAISAEVYDDSDVEVTVYFRKFGEGMDKAHRAQMLKVGNNYQAVIPGIAVMDDIEYFLEAFDVQGNGPTRHGSDKKPHQVKVGDTAGKVAVVAPPPPPPPDGGDRVIAANPIAAPPPPMVVEPEEPSGPKADLTFVWAALGAGGAGLLSGTIFLVMAGSAEDEATKGGNDRTQLNELLDQAATRRTVSLISFAAGGAALAAGGALFFLLKPQVGSSSGGMMSTSAVDFAPSAPGADVGATMRVRF